MRAAINPCAQSGCGRKFDAGEPDRIRTCDLLIKSQLLYQLSYGPTRIGADRHVVPPISGRLVAMRLKVNVLYRFSIYATVRGPILCVLGRFIVADSIH